MDSEYILGPDGELYHWGTKGMKWGIRRYQNKDGSLTPAGKKRYKSTEEELKAREKVIKNKERAKAKLAKLEAKKAELDAREKALEDDTKSGKAKPSDTAKPKSIKDMTDEELRAHTNRMQLETNYINAQKNLTAATPKQVTNGEKFIKSLMDSVVAPAAKNAGKEWLEKTLKDSLGLNKKEVDALAKLKKEYETLDYKNKIEKLKKGESEKTNWDDKKKQQDYEKAEKNKELEDLQREIALLTAQSRLEAERKKRTEQGDS